MVGGFIIVRYPSRGQNERILGQVFQNNRPHRLDWGNLSCRKFPDYWSRINKNVSSERRVDFTKLLSLNRSQYFPKGVCLSSSPDMGPVKTEAYVNFYPAF